MLSKFLDDVLGVLALPVHSETHCRKPAVEQPAFVRLGVCCREWLSCRAGSRWPRGLFRESRPRRICTALAVSSRPGVCRCPRSKRWIMTIAFAFAAGLVRLLSICRNPMRPLISASKLTLKTDYSRPMIRLSGVTSIFPVAGIFGNPGIVMISPQIATTNSAPAERRTSRIGTT